MLKIEQQKIMLTRGDSATIKFVPIYKDGSSYQTTSGDRAIFRLREGRILIEIECNVDVQDNDILLDIQPMHTTNLKTGLHKYEVELLPSYGKHWTFVADQPFVIGNDLKEHDATPAESILLPEIDYHNNIPVIVGEIDGEPPVVSGLVQEGRPSQDYNRLDNLPSLNGVTIKGDKTTTDYHLGTAANYNVAAEGDASVDEIVKGDDTRLTDSRPASDVYEWAKSPTKPQYTKGDVGLGNVDNTSDAVKKMDFTGHIASGNTGFVTGDEAKIALDQKMNAYLKGIANGVAELDATGKVPSSQLPSYVDGTVEGYLVDETHFYKEDVAEAYYWEGNFYEDIGHTIPIVPKENVIYTDITTGTTFKWDAETSSYVRASRTQIIGETDKIYVDLYSNLTYRWSGTIFVEISPSLALGETSSTAYRGDRGKVAYEHATETKLSEAVESGLYKIAATSEGHIESLTPVQKSDITGLGVADELGELDDVAINSPSNGQVVKYNATTQKFENADETVRNAFKNVKVADTVIPATTGEDTLELVAGTNVTLTPDVVNKKVTINSSGGGGTSTGDMLKAIYDTNNDGIVNAADEATTLTGLNATVSELNYLQDATGNIQEQLNGKAATSDIPDDLADLNDDSTHRLVTDTEKQTWNNKSDFDGSYNSLTDQPTLGTASELNVAVSGNAGQNEVVKGNDTRLSDSRTPLSHTHTTSDITDFPDMTEYIMKSATAGLVKSDGSIDTTSYQPTEAGKGLSANDYTNSDKAAVTALGTASTKNVPASGNASSTEVVLGNDSRLSDARTPLSHTHTCSDITDLEAIPVADVQALFV